MLKQAKDGVIIIGHIRVSEKIYNVFRFFYLGVVESSSRANENYIVLKYLDVLIFSYRYIRKTNATNSCSTVCKLVSFMSHSIISYLFSI